MARYEQDREDLLREATAFAERIELRTAGAGTETFLGFRTEGSASIYFGPDFVLHFNAAGEIRRAFVESRLLKAVSGALVGMTRRRAGGNVILESTALTESEAAGFLKNAERAIDQLSHSLREGSFQVIGQVPGDRDLTARAQAWLLGLPRPLLVARKPNVDRS